VEARRVGRLPHIGASAAERIDTGFERVPARIVRADTTSRHDPGAGRHRTLLRAVAKPIPGGRPAIVSETCLARLDRLRAFRHRERNAHGFDLDLGIVTERRAEAGESFDILRVEVMVVLDRDRPSDAPNRARVPLGTRMDGCAWTPARRFWHRTRKRQEALPPRVGYRNA